MKSRDDSLFRWRLSVVLSDHVRVVVNPLWTAEKKEAALSFEENWNAKKNWREKRERGKIGIPRMTVSISVLHRSVLAWQPLAGKSVCRLLLLSQPVFVCQTACMANLRLYSRLQTGESHIQCPVCQIYKRTGTDKHPQWQEDKHEEEYWTEHCVTHNVTSKIQNCVVFRLLCSWLKKIW